jgi:hypothetical protein
MTSPRTWFVTLFVAALVALPVPGSAQAAKAPAARDSPAAPAVPPALCKGRSVLVFEDARTSQLAMDGLIADIEMLTASKGAGDSDVGKNLAAGLQAAGCAVVHWEEPLVSISVVDGKKTAFYGGDRKQEPYQPEHKLTGNELDTHHVVVWIRRGAVEQTKKRHGEGLRIDYKAEAQVQARGQKKQDLDANWKYVQDDLPQAAYGGYTSYTDEEAARKKGVAKFAPIRVEQEAAFRTALHQAVQAALTALPPAP